MSHDLLTADFQPAVYWWEDAARPVEESQALPAEVDVLVVGSGYTGLHAAWQTVRAGLSTLVLDSESLGDGCSSRNGGQVSTSVKGTFPSLAKEYGHTQAVDLLREGNQALDFLDTFIREQQLDCDWTQCGRFHGAHNQSAYTASARAMEAIPAEVANDWHMVDRTEQRREIGTDLYHGGIVHPHHRSLHPGRYHLELLGRVQASGAQTVGHCPVEQIQRNADGSFTVQTGRGQVQAGQVAIATNGYTGTVTPWLRRRVIPIGSYIIATEPLPAQVAKELIPNNRVITDSRKLVVYYRLSPDQRRIVFGGRVAVSETNPRASVKALHQSMCRIFPQLKSTRISHSWLGFVGYTFDTLPHIGQQDGLHYAMGYCGSGISLASYCGSIMGERLSGRSDRHSAFEDLEFKSRPYYFGKPWFLQPAVSYYKLQDRM